MIMQVHFKLVDFRASVVVDTLSSIIVSQEPCQFDWHSSQLVAVHQAI